MFIRMFNYKLNAQPNALKFGQHVCECTRINPRNTDYDLKLGVVGPLSYCLSVTKWSTTLELLFKCGRTTA